MSSDVAPDLWEGGLFTDPAKKWHYEQTPEWIMDVIHLSKCKEVNIVNACTVPAFPLKGIGRVIPVTQCPSPKLPELYKFSVS